MVNAFDKDVVFFGPIIEMSIYGNSVSILAPVPNFIYTISIEKIFDYKTLCPLQKDSSAFERYKDVAYFSLLEKYVFVHYQDIQLN